MCVSNLMFINMANEDVNVLEVMYGVEFDVNTSNSQDVSNPVCEDVFKDIDFDCSSELSSLSDEEQDITKPTEVLTRKHLVIGKHIEIINGEQIKYKCTICKCQFSWKQQIRYHDYCVTGKRPLKCDLCDKRFVKKSHLVYHTRTHSGESPYQCSICSKTFKQLGKLKRHEKIHKVPGEADKFQCSICKQKYCDRDSLKKHEHKHDKSKTSQCKHCKKKFVDEFALKQHLATHQVPKFICEVCGRRFRWKNSLNIHLQMHEDLYPHQCSQCKKTFRTKKELNQHDVVHDKSDPKFECSLCSIMFGRKDNLLRHVRNCHLDPRAKNEQSPKKITKDLINNDAKDLHNSKNSIDDEHPKKLPAVTADDPSSSVAGLMNEDSSSRGKKKDCLVTNKNLLSNKPEGGNKINIKRKSRKLKKSGGSDMKSTPMASSHSGNAEERILGNDKSANLKADRKSVVITISTPEAPVDLSKTEAVINEKGQDKEFPPASAKTSVIVHTSSLLHEANLHREPVIKFFRPPPSFLNPESLVPDPT